MGTVWMYFLVTGGAIIVAATYFFAIRFFRRIYFMIDEIDARLIQIRNLIETGAASGKRKKPQQRAGPTPVSPQPVEPGQTAPRRVEPEPPSSRTSYPQ